MRYRKASVSFCAHPPFRRNPFWHPKTKFRPGKLDRRSLDVAVVCLFRETKRNFQRCAQKAAWQFTATTSSRRTHKRRCEFLRKHAGPRPCFCWVRRQPAQAGFHTLEMPCSLHASSCSGLAAAVQKRLAAVSCVDMAAVCGPWSNLRRQTCDLFTFGARHVKFVLVSGNKQNIAFPPPRPFWSAANAQHEATSAGVYPQQAGLRHRLLVPMPPELCCAELFPLARVVRNYGAMSRDTTVPNLCA